MNWEDHRFGFAGLSGHLFCVEPDSIQFQLFSSVIKEKVVNTIEGLDQTDAIYVDSIEFMDLLEFGQVFDRNKLEFVTKQKSSLIHGLNIFSKVRTMGTFYHFQLFKDSFGQYYVSGYSKQNNPNDSIFVEDERESTHKEYDTVRVLTYNVWNLNLPYHQRISNLLEQVNKVNPDIIAFQEVRYTTYEYPTKNGKENGFQVDDLSNKLRNYNYFYYPGMTYFRNSEYTQEGVAIFSKYDIIDYSHLNLSRNFSDRADEHQRILGRALVDTPIGNINVYSSHFSLSETARKRNLVEIGEYISKFDGMHILSGDLNTEPQSLTTAYFEGDIELSGRKMQFSDAFKESVKIKNKFASEQDILEAGWTFLTFNDTPRKRIDFMYYEKSKLNLVECNIVDNEGYGIYYNNEMRYPSDHRGFYCDFSIVQ
eukprot:TRINITY_DN6115_c0_g1_i1.p1 TRINITY_DN6115_c0_g1~~TRINITY_DN6115_c0_g1_i1.p1  ORF type:complete len:455 (+),score=83.77 TRINITY_DN6115_c0_g1_i1:94-1365(+)